MIDQTPRGAAQSAIVIALEDVLRRLPQPIELSDLQFGDPDVLTELRRTVGEQQIDEYAARGLRRLILLAQMAFTAAWTSLELDQSHDSADHIEADTHADIVLMLSDLVDKWATCLRRDLPQP